MKAGRGLDARIAEKVMKLLNVGLRNTGVGYETHLAYYLPSLKECRTVPHYSTQIADAWLVVEKLRKANWNVSTWYTYVVLADSKWRCKFEGDELTYQAEATTAPLAICLAALKATE